MRYANWKFRSSIGIKAPLGTMSIALNAAVVEVVLRDMFKLQAGGVFLCVCCLSDPGNFVFHNRRSDRVGGPGSFKGINLTRRESDG